MGIRDRPITPGSPWQNGYAERLIGTLRRECLGQVLIFGETHLRRILSAYAVYYNQASTHWRYRKMRLRARTVVTSDRVGLPKPWHPDSVQTLAATPCAYRKPKSGRNGDGGCLGPRVI